MTLTAEQMHRALGLVQQATSLRKQFDTYKLAAKHGGQSPEAINVCYKESGSWSDEMKGGGGRSFRSPKQRDAMSLTCGARKPR